MQLTIGIDIGGTNTRIGIVSSEGKVLGLSKLNTTDFNDGARYADAIANAIQKLVADFEAEHTPDTCEWRGIGIGAPNGNIHTGCIESPPNLKFKGDTPIVQLLQDRLPSIGAIKLTNDANAAAVGEKIFGGAKEFSDFIMITLGTGLGSGIFVNNQLVYGANGMAGELGHVTAVPQGRYCGYSRRGSLENYCSATGIRRTFFEMMSQYGIPTLLDDKKLSEINSKDISDAAYAGDKTAIETMKFTGKMLGEALASFALFSAPEAFFLFGGPVQAGSILMDPLRRSFKSHLIPQYRDDIQIIESELPMGDAAILGAAALIV